MTDPEVRLYEFSIANTVERLRTSLETVLWAVSILPNRWTHSLPEHYPIDSWSVAMNVAHLAVYEELVAAPVLEALATDRDDTNVIASADERVEEARRVADQTLAQLTARLCAARERQIAAVAGFEAGRFNVPASGYWGALYPLYGSRLHSAAWIATKTFQHTWEHGNTIMRLALYTPE